MGVNFNRVVGTLSLLLMIAVSTMTAPIQCAEQPFRLRVSKLHMRNTFNLGMSNLFQNVFRKVKMKNTIFNNDGRNMELVDRLVYSIGPKSAVQNFDVSRVNLEKDNFGVEELGGRLRVEIVASMRDGRDLSFSFPIDHFILQYKLTQEYSPEYNYNMQKFVKEKLSVDFGEATASEGSELPEPAAIAEMKDRIGKNILEFVEKVENWNNDEVFLHIFHNGRYVDEIPFEMTFPFGLVYYIAGLSETIEFEKDYITLGISLKHFNLLSEKQLKNLKPVKGDFYNTTSEHGEEFLHLLIDENFINSFTTLLTSINRSFSARKIMQKWKKTRDFLPMLKTGTIGQVLPTFKEEYGSDKLIDLRVSPSHKQFLKGMPKSRITGVQIDKSGNWKALVNLVAEIDVERAPGEWKNGRVIYATVAFKFKTVVASKDPNKIKFSVQPKSLEISNLKVMKGKEEMELEQMMIQSAVNIQMENLDSLFKEYKVEWKDLEMPFFPIQCFGFGPADLKVSFKKGQVQVLTFTKWELDNSLNCVRWMAELRTFPTKFLREFKVDEIAQILQDNLKSLQKDGPEGIINHIERDFLMQHDEL